MIHLRCLALFFVAVLFNPSMVHAAAKPVAPPPDTRRLIQSVNAANSSVVIVLMRDKNAHTYKVDDVTQLTINNVKGKFGEIKAGMVVVDYVERDADDLDLLSLSGDGTPPKTSAKPKK